MQPQKLANSVHKFNTIKYCRHKKIPIIVAKCSNSVIFKFVAKFRHIVIVVFYIKVEVKVDVGD